ncbi:MAG: LysR family transcriptional regulator [Hyphomicrobiaceae bacterium]
MSVIHLRSFVEVYRQHSISRAAEELGLTQPTVSQHIASLEAQLERKLFERHARGVAPTVVAEDLFNKVSDGLDRAENALAEMQARSNRLAGTLHLCGSSDILSDLVVPKLRILTENNLSLRLYPSQGETTMELLLAGDADFAFAVAEPVDKRIGGQRIGMEELVLVAHPSMAPHMKRRRDLPKVLSSQPFVAYEQGLYLIRLWLEHNEIDVGRAEQNVIAPDLRCLRNLVVENFGWSVLPRYLIGSSLKAGAMIEISGPNGNPTTPYYALWLKSAMRSPRLTRAKELVLSQFVSTTR